MSRVDLYLDDFRVGERFESTGLTLTQSMIVDFALTYDPQPFHIDAEAAAASAYGGLIASGFQTLAIGFRLLYQTGFLRSASLGGPGMDEVRWLRPVRPGDTLRAAATVREARPSASKPDRGVLKLDLEMTNQRGEVVTTAIMVIFVKRR